MGIKNKLNKDGHQYIKSGGKKRSQEQFKDAADINKIMERARGGAPISTGEQGTRKMFFGDFSEPFDLQEARNAVIKADELFMALPLKVRSRFENKPEKLLEFIDDKENREEAIKLGFIEKPEIVKEEKTALQTEIDHQKVIAEAKKLLAKEASDN